ncbi:MAG: zf-C3Hc3H domain-containing protein [Chloroflexi bacterium]|nr:zf-C3Hc3H domain-containing protein [Chloroflexota bacterium]MCI0646433.1 zf-C3Hc3H domain-containing protein [Chloroflexota bacterium]
MSSQRCTATRADGQPCQAWAVHGSDPPTCVAHTAAGRTPSESFYGRVYTLEEIADLVARAAGDSLDDELAATRVAIRRVMEQLHDELPPEEYARLASLVFTGATAIARLLRAKRAISGLAADGIAGAIAQALNELSNEWNIEL